MSTLRADLEFAEQVLNSLQEHRSRDRVEFVVDLGLDWSRLQPTLSELVREGFVDVNQVDGEDVFVLASSDASPTTAGIAA